MEMKMKTITIVGVGALGSHAVQFLRNSGATIRVIDFDRVEQKNTSSQFHGVSQVGKSKVASLQQAMLFLFKSKLEVIPHKLTKDNQKQLLGGADLVIDCLDNGEARRLVQSYVRAENIPCVHGALAADGGFGRVIWDEKFEIDDATGGAATCENGEHLPFIGVVATLLAKAAQDFLLHGKKTGFQIHPAGVFAV
jgi:molybdopterin/thiamine biosynthesis adenylyltransferase